MTAPGVAGGTMDISVDTLYLSVNYFGTNPWTYMDRRGQRLETSAANADAPGAWVSMPWCLVLTH
uniref:Uncharacterized protein n=1 Tax=Oryza glaberrima TaxID=4538 RepID=I1PPQ1_ORYGL